MIKSSDSKPEESEELRVAFQSLNIDSEEEKKDSPSGSSSGKVIEENKGITVGNKVITEVSQISTLKAKIQDMFAERKQK